MASKRPLCTLFSAAISPVRSARRIQHSSTVPNPTTSTSTACAFSTSSSRRYVVDEVEEAQLPRWKQTPARMVAPVRIRRQRGPAFEVNNDPLKLDEMYRRMLGPNGEKLLSDEVKWLAVTHKSFDHGRRGFNDRLAYLGMSMNHL